MDKQYLTLEGLKKQELNKLFSSDNRALLRKLEHSGVLQRKRKLKTYRVLLHAAKLYLVKHLSLRRLSYEMAAVYGVSLSDTAWKKQLLKFAPVFLCAAQDLLSRRLDVCAPAPMLAIDATHFSMEGSAEQVFRVHTSIALPSGTVEQFLLTDQHIAESVKHFRLQPGQCYLADRAYGSAAQMAHMIEHGTHFLFRLTPSKIRLFYDAGCQEKIDCRSLLTGETFSRSCFFEYRHHRYKIQLVGAKLPQEKREAAARRLKRKAQKKQWKVGPQALIFADWVILATSMPQADARLCEGYRQRWQIELFFKTAKSLLNFHRLRRCSDRWARQVISIWMAFVSLLSALYLKLSSFSSAVSPFFFSVDFLLALLP